MTILIALVGAGFAGGLCLLVGGLRPRSVGDRPPHPARRLPDDLRVRLTRAGIAAAAIGVATRWPTMALAAAAAGWWSPELLGAHAQRDRAVRRTEAIAAWTEMLRDTIAGAHGLEETIVTTAAVAPTPIRVEVVSLAARLEHQSLSSSLAVFASELAHPTADLVVTALAIAANAAVKDLGELLGTLATSARDEAGMRLRVESARARSRTAVRVIATCTASTAGGLAILSRSYLHVYSGAVGQGVLGLIAAVWGLSLWWLARMSEFDSPERFLVAPSTESLR